MASEIRAEIDIVDSVEIRSDHVVVLLKNWLPSSKLTHLPVILSVPDSTYPAVLATPEDAAQNLYKTIRQVLDEGGLMVYVSPGHQLTTGGMTVSKIEDCIREVQLNEGYVDSSTCWQWLHGIDESYFLEQPRLLMNGHIEDR